MPLSTQAAMSKDKLSGKHVELQHRHFSFIAAVIAEIPDRMKRLEMAFMFADACSETNKAFDRERFMRACGVY